MASYLLYLREFGRNKQSPVVKYIQRLATWELRQGTKIAKAERPSNLAKAHQLGYRAKEGYHLFRVSVKRGGRPKKTINGKTYGKPSKSGIYQRKPSQSLQAIGEMRVGKKCPQYHVLCSYWIGEDRANKYFEVIMVDPHCKAIQNDSKINWICDPSKAHRESRGLTNGTRTSRGLGKGIRYNQTKGGSRAAAWRKGNTLSLTRYR